MIRKNKTLVTVEQIINLSQTNWNNILVPEEQKFGGKETKSLIQVRLIKTIFFVPETPWNKS
jgi:hypothetical protein